jgi:uncharacterized protein
MAEPYDTLLQVQALDTELDQLHHRIEALPERGELASVRAERAGLATATAELRVQVDELAGRQGALEAQIAASAGRRHELEARMRSGGVTAARDLQAMDAEVNQLADRQRTLEDQELVLMEEQEPLDEALAGHEARTAALVADEERLVAAVSEAEAALRTSIGTVATARAEQAAGLPTDLAERYERLRAHLGGTGAARLIGDRCDGCHLTLSSVELEGLRSLPADTFATCPQCDRILVH